MRYWNLFVLLYFLKITLSLAMNVEKKPSDQGTKPTLEMGGSSSSKKDDEIPPVVFLHRLII